MAELRQPPSIDAYGGGGFRVSGRRIEGSILILDDKLYSWPVASLAQLGPDDIAPVLAAGLSQVEFLLLGVGARVAPPPPALRKVLQDAGLGLEVMDTATAARVYNVLVSEGRRLAAALIAI
ncbi:MAG: hypothetical protein JWO72_1405 [Caulobacteraceae bacterium]|nr:hypothetical protein [Caulobacteraceae bacterium]